MTDVSLQHRRTVHGVVEREFRREGCTGILWSPEMPLGPSALVILGSATAASSSAPAIEGTRARAQQLARTFGFHVAIVEDRAEGRMPPAWEARREERRAEHWQAAIDVLQELPGVDGRRPVGLRGTGADAGTALRVAAEDARIGAATIGAVAATPSLLALAGRILVPVQVVMPWDDPDLVRTAGLALFDAITSADKSLRVHLGTRHTLPADEADESAWFLARHLLISVPAAAR